jgi:iron complex transport system substrate-binding protein
MTTFFIKICLAALGVFASATMAHAVTVTDDSGTRVQIDKAPQRIVSLLPSLTETVCALGACARLVGVDRYSNSPSSVLGLPRLGGGLDPNIEAVVAQKPDLVLVATSCPAIARLRSLGLQVVALEPQSHADVERVLLRVGQMLQVDTAPQVWRRMNDEIDAIARSLRAPVQPPRVYFEVGALYAAGEASFIGETLTRLGAKNIVPASMGPFPKLNPEFVVRANPDVVMVTAEDSGALPARPGWGQMRAVREGRICRFSAAEGDTLARAGPRVAEAAALLAKCLRGLVP